MSAPTAPNDTSAHQNRFFLHSLIVSNFAAGALPPLSSLLLIDIGSMTCGTIVNRLEKIRGLQRPPRGYTHNPLRIHTVPTTLHSPLFGACLFFGILASSLDTAAIKPRLSMIAAVVFTLFARDPTIPLQREGTRLIKRQHK